MLFSGSFAACGVNDGPVVPVHLADLAAYAPFYDGRRIEAAGVVHRIEEPEHYWIEDDAVNRVRIEPGSAVAAFVGRRVRVTGRFHYAPDEGRSLRAGRVAIIEAETDTSGATVSASADPR